MNGDFRPSTEARREASPEGQRARMEEFDSFWEGPDDVESGYRKFGRFYAANYLRYLPDDPEARILVISCGPGYFVNLLAEKGYENVEGIESREEKLRHAVARGLNCRRGTAFETLRLSSRPWDVIICEQELNHLSKSEMVDFLDLVGANLTTGGRLICHGLNGANPIVGAETLAQNFDHFNTFTEYSMRQVLEYCGFEDVTIFGLNLYVFYWNPLNYIAAGASATLSLLFRALFVLYGKSNRTFSKKLGAVGFKS